MRQGPEARTSPGSAAPLRPGVTPSRPWAWPGATGGRRGGGGDRWRAAGPEPGQAMAASERLYELWLLYYAQVSPSRPWSSGPPDPRAPCLLHLRPLPPGRRWARARGVPAPITRACPWPPGFIGHLCQWDNVRERALYFKSPAKPRSLSCPGQSLYSLPFSQLGKLRLENKGNRFACRLLRLHSR